MADVDEIPAELRGLTVTYCGVCSMPPEYCEYGGRIKKCQDWLQANVPELYNRIWSPEALKAATASLSVEAQQRAVKDAQKKAAKAEAAEAKEAEKVATSTVTIKRIMRNKNKFVTSVTGLENFGYDLKKVAKEFGKKFATGSSVTRHAAGHEEIVVQGDVSPEVGELLREKYPNVPHDHIEFIEEKKKKKSN